MSYNLKLHSGLCLNKSNQLYDEIDTKPCKNMANLIEILVGILTIIYKLLESFVLLFVPASLLSKKVDKDIVLITGGGNGMGRQLAVKFAKLGSTIVIWDVNKQGNEETCRIVKKNGGQISSYICDVTDRNLVYATAERVKKDVGKVTILINNAGLVAGKRLLEIPDQQIEKVFAVNAISHFWTCKAFLPDMMVANKGHVVNVASMAGMFGVEGLTEYCASKHAVLGFTESLTMELRFGGFRNINVTAVCPMAVDTGFFDGFKLGPFPMLKPEYVTDKIVQAVLTNQRLIMLPKYMFILVLAKCLLPIEVGLVLADLFGAGEATKNFRGRNGAKNETGSNGQSTSNGAITGKAKNSSSKKSK